MGIPPAQTSTTRHFTKLFALSNKFPLYSPPYNFTNKIPSNTPFFKTL
ncbi:MAG: hypothetical protein MR902_01615 [Campylobacter sp.]|nr:hypothetical protein [Campylobacter sp.]